MRVPSRNSRKRNPHYRPIPGLPSWEISRAGVLRRKLKTPTKAGRAYYYLRWLQDAGLAYCRPHGGEIYYRDELVAEAWRDVPPCSALTISEMQDIVDEVALGANREALARKYGVTRPTIWRIVTGRSWAQELGITPPALTLTPGQYDEI